MLKYKLNNYLDQSATYGIELKLLAKNDILNIFEK